MKAGFESDPQHFRQSMRDPSMRDMKRKINGSRDFLWTRKVLLRDNVKHSSSQNVETTSLSARRKQRGEKTWAKECSKPYRNRPLLACLQVTIYLTQIMVTNSRQDSQVRAFSNE